MLSFHFAERRGDKGFQLRHLARLPRLQVLAVQGFQVVVSSRGGGSLLVPKASSVEVMEPRSMHSAMAGHSPGSFLITRQYPWQICKNYLGERDSLEAEAKQGHHD